MSCKKCIEEILRVSHSMYEPTVAKLKSVPLCDRGKELYRDYYICDNIKGSFHRPKRFDTFKVIKYE